MGETGLNRDAMLQRLIQTTAIFRTYWPPVNADSALIFFEVARSPGLSMKQIGERTGLPLQTVSRHVASLCAVGQKDSKKALVLQKECPEDRRVRTVSLTRRGEKLVGEIEAIHSF